MSNTATGLITSTLFGYVEKADGETRLTDEKHYTEFADSVDNDDIIINENLTNSHYGLVITFNVREFKVKINATLTATNGAEVLDTDFVNIVLVHINKDGNVDYAYSIDLYNGQEYIFDNIYNGLLDKSYLSIK